MGLHPSTLLLLTAHRPSPCAQTRTTMPHELRVQLGYIREAAECFGVPTISRRGIEADDLIATAVARARSEGVGSVCVITSDKDLLQLVTPAGGGQWRYAILYI